VPDTRANTALATAVTASQDECAPQTHTPSLCFDSASLALRSPSALSPHSRLIPTRPLATRASYFHDEVVARLRDKLSAPSYDPVLSVAFAALSACMWNCGPRFHAAVARGELLGDVVAALAAHRWPLALARSAAAAIATWAERARAVPEFRAAAATLRAERVTENDLAGLTDAVFGEFAPGSHSAALANAARFADGAASGSAAMAADRGSYAARGGLAVPLRANGGVVGSAADSDNAAVQAALREAEAKTRAHVEEHLASGVDFSWARKAERKALHRAPDQYMAPPTTEQYSAPLNVYGPGARETTKPKDAAAMVAAAAAAAGVAAGAGSPKAAQDASATAEAEAGAAEARGTSAEEALAIIAAAMAGDGGAAPPKPPPAVAITAAAASSEPAAAPEAPETPAPASPVAAAAAAAAIASAAAVVADRRKEAETKASADEAAAAKADKTAKAAAAPAEAAPPAGAKTGKSTAADAKHKTLPATPATAAANAPAAHAAAALPLSAAPMELSSLLPLAALRVRAAS
jgi:hypothetical protein